ncbi:MAG: sigma-54-dependent Fis family transcriptional regulator [Victivallales bacterium]|nr:sigma-54-dependent Fis family transcriptional regulator [Victivallales bacterium]
MAAKLPTILVIDDERNTREGLRDAFEDKYDILLADSAAAGLDVLKKRHVDVVLTDLRMPGMDGMAFTQEVSSWNDAPLIIMLTAYGSVQTAMAAMRAGAYDYLTKPVKLDDLEMMIDRGLEVLRERRSGGAVADASSENAGIIGSSPAMAAVLDEARQVADARSTVLITGESGTGKELFAHAIHAWSPRANKPFVAVHCAALNENLLESELFGHEKGAYTGANERFIGRFERADHGTLFLDEIGEISLPTQVKLLRVLETRNLERVGGSTTIPVDVRLIAATNRDLPAMVREGTFREDLYYRLNVVNLRLPALREHREDIPALIEHFLKIAAQDNGKKMTGITADALAVLRSYDWPGNIRELRNCVERMVVLARGTLLTVSDIPREIVDAFAGTAEEAPNGHATAAAQPAVPSTPVLDIHENERAAIRQALEQANGNRTRAAEILGISRRTLQRKLKQEPGLEGGAGETI